VTRKCLAHAMRCSSLFRRRTPVPDGLAVAQVFRRVAVSNISTGFGSDQDALDLIEVDLVVPAIIEARGPRALMVRHLLSDL